VPLPRSSCRTGGEKTDKGNTEHRGDDLEHPVGSIAEGLVDEGSDGGRQVGKRPDRKDQDEGPEIKPFIGRMHGVSIEQGHTKYQKKIRPLLQGLTRTGPAL
jgi:hypothetical protein